MTSQCSTRVALNDVMTPAIGAFGVLAALFHRERTDEGQQIELALARTGMAIQAAEFTRVAGAPAGGGFPRGAIDFPGPDAGQRWYRCADGELLFIEAASNAEREALIGCAGVALQPAQLAAPFGTPPNEIATQALTTAFATRERDEWLDGALGGSVGCAPISGGTSRRPLPTFVDNDLSVVQPHPDWGTTTNYGLLIRPGVTRGKLDRVAPRLSEHAARGAEEAGYDEGAIAAMAASGVVLFPEA